MTRGAFALWCACVAAEGVALVMAVRCVFRRGQGREFLPNPWSIREQISVVVSAAKGADPLFRPIVALLTFAVAEDVAVRLLIDLVIAPSPRPLHGLARGAYHLADALVMGWPLGLAWVAWRVFVLSAAPPDASAMSSVAPGGVRALGGDLLGHHPASVAALPRRASHRSTDILGAVYFGTVIALVGLHPLGAANTSRVLLAWEIVALGFAVVAIVRGWRRAVRGEVTWTVAHGVLLVLVPVEASVCAIGPFARPDVFSAWHVARWQYLAAFAIVAGMLGVRRRAVERSRSAP